MKKSKKDQYVRFRIDENEKKVLKINDIESRR
jgi:hypothetical protein